MYIKNKVLNTDVIFLTLTQSDKRQNRDQTWKHPIKAGIARLETQGIQYKLKPRTA